MWIGLGVVGVIVLAVFFRFYDLQNYPPGLFPDQAANGEDALLILSGDARPFYERGNGREGMFFYLQALLIWLFGIGVWQLFAASAIVGTLTVAAMYFATRPYFGRLAGLSAAFFLATSYWHATLSRTGFRAIQIPLMVAAFTACVGYVVMSVKRATPTPSPSTDSGLSPSGRGRKNAIAQAYIFAVLAGVFFAGGFYTYIAYRVMIGVVLGIFLIWLIASLHPKIGWPHLVRYWRCIVVGILASALTLSPLIFYFVQHPEAVIGRAGQVSVFNPDLQRPGGLIPTIVWSARETIFSFFAGTGDLNWRHNVAGYPLLNPLVASLFLIGLAWTILGFFGLLKKLIRGEEVHLGLIFPYVLLLLSGMLLPVITTAEGIPHGLRSVGLIVPIFMLAGTAAAVIIRWTARRLAPISAGHALAIGLIGGLLVVGVWYDGLLYFAVSKNDSEAHYSYRADLTEVSVWLKHYAAENPQAPRPYLALDAFSVQTVHYLTHSFERPNRINPPAHDYQTHPDEAQHLYRLVKPEDSERTVLTSGEVMIFTQSTLPDADRYAAAWAATYGEPLEVVVSSRNIFYQETMRIYRAAGEAAPAGEDGADPPALDA